MNKTYTLCITFLYIAITFTAGAQRLFKSLVSPDILSKSSPGIGLRTQNIFVEAGGQGLTFTATYDTRLMK